MAKVKHIVTFSGRLTSDPRMFEKKKGGKLASFTVCMQDNKKYDAVYIPCVCLLDDLTEYIIGNFRKGDFISITSGKLANNYEQKFKINTLKVIVWDICDPETGDAVRGDVPTEEQEEKAEDDIPF